MTKFDKIYFGLYSKEIEKGMKKGGGEINSEFMKKVVLEI
jgi:hypothetical protein